MVEKRRVGQTEERLEGGNMQEVDETRREEQNEVRLEGGHLQKSEKLQEDPLSPALRTLWVIHLANRAIWKDKRINEMQKLVS